MWERSPRTLLSELSPQICFYGRGYTSIGMKCKVISKGIVGIKMGWKHYQKIDCPPPSPSPSPLPPKREPQVGSGLFGVHLLILHFQFQFSKPIKSSTVHIFLNLTYPFRKNIPFPKCPKIYTTLPNSGYGNE